MKTNCSVIEDLLPLYIDGVCGDESKKMVEEHLEKCHGCKIKYINLKEDIVVEHVEIEKNLEAVKPFKKIKQKENISKVIIASLVVIFMGIQTGLFYYREAQNNKIVEFEDDALGQYLIEVNNVLYGHVNEYGDPGLAGRYYLDFQDPVPSKYLVAMQNGEIPRGYLSMFTTLTLGVDILLRDEFVDPGSLTNIIAAFKKIKSLEDMDKFENLRTLNVNNLNVTDLSPISRIKNLYFLTLTKLDLPDLAPIVATKDLQILHLRETSIKNLEHLNQIPKLSNLQLTNNINLKDIVIRDNKTINSLDINNTQFSQFTGRLHLENLESLEFMISQGGSYEDITLNNLPRLRSMELSSNEFISIDKNTLSSTGSNVLEMIAITGPNNIENLNFLSDIDTLQVLQLMGSTLGKIILPSNLRDSKIHTLVLENSNLTGITGLQNLSYLYNLELSNNEIEDISFLFDENDNLIIQTLRYLKLDNNKIPQWQIDKYEPILQRHLEAFEIGEQR